MRCVLLQQLIIGSITGCSKKSEVWSPLQTRCICIWDYMDGVNQLQQTVGTTEGLNTDVCDNDHLWRTVDYLLSGSGVVVWTQTPCFNMYKLETMPGKKLIEYFCFVFPYAICLLHHHAFHLAPILNRECPARWAEGPHCLLQAALGSSTLYLNYRRL